MADTYHTIGATGIKKKIVDLGDGTCADAVSTMPRALSTEAVLAAAADSAGGLGKIGTVVNTGTIYVRQAVSPGQDIEWRVQSDQKYTVQKYKARTNVTGGTITLAAATRVDDEDTFVLQGLTNTAEATAESVSYATRLWKCGGADEDADAAALAALLNADYAVVTAGTSVAATDKLVITTDECAHTIVAAAAADYPAGKYGLSSTQATELASIVLAINHRDTITVGQDTTALTADTTPTAEAEDYALADELGTDHNTHTALITVHKQATAAVSFTAADNETKLVAEANAVRAAMLAHYADTDAHNAADATNLALVDATTVATNAATARTLITALVAPFEAHIATAKVQAGDTFIVNDLVFTGHATATTASKREFKVDEATASDTADELVTLLNDSTYGVEDTTAVNSSGAIGITRDTADVTVTITAAPAAASVHSCITIDEAGGVPGIIAVATGGAGELAITPVWTEVLTVTEAGDQLTVTDIDTPGILATVEDAVITLTPGTPGGTTEMAPVIQFGQGTSDADEIAFVDTTLASLAADGDVVTDAAANNTTAGKIYSQTMNGWEYGYIGITNKSGGAAATFVVGATLH